MTLIVIKRMTLFFWAAWLSAVVTTNVLNGLQALVLYRIRSSSSRGTGIGSTR